MAKKAHAYRRIGEVADWLGVPTSTIRYWGTKFKQVKPVQRAGGRRYYRVEDMVLLGGIKVMLHEQGASIEELRKLMRTAEAVAEVARLSPMLPDGIEHPGAMEHGADVMRFERPPAPVVPQVEEAEEVEEVRRVASGGAPGGLHIGTSGRGGSGDETAPADRSDEDETAEDPVAEVADEPTAEAPTVEVAERVEEAEPVEVAFDLSAPLPAAEGLPEDERPALPPLGRHQLRAARPEIAGIVAKLEAIRARMGRR